MADSIQEMYDTIKSMLKDDGFYYGSIIVLVAVLSFGLGRWSMSEQVTSQLKETVTVTQGASLGVLSELNSATTSPKAQKTLVEEVKVPPQPSVPTAVTAENALYVGSKSGEKYHLLTCPGAKQIKAENKIYFASKEDAMRNGYLPASNCKGI